MPFTVVLRLEPCCETVCLEIIQIRKLINWKSNKSAGSPKYLPERCRTSVPAVTTNFYRNAVLARKYLPERHSGAFRHHYTTGPTLTMLGALEVVRAAYCAL